jgi:hypothetical protein
VQPIYRYFVSLYHWLFGQSTFAGNMADVWCILGTTILIAKFAIKFRISPLITYIACTTYLGINFISAFRYIIGKSLVEFHAMIFVMLAAWLMYKAREGGPMRIVALATLMGILGYWIRQDHLGAIAGLAFFVFEPVEGPTGGWKGYWERFQARWGRLAWYWIGGILSVLLISYRNYLVGGGFYPTDVNAPIWDVSKRFEVPIIVAAYTILSGVAHWPQFPSFSSIVLVGGTFTALIALIWRPKPLVNFPLSIGIILIGLFGPYIWVWNGGYPPRFSIYLLPLATLSLFFLINNLFDISKFSFESKNKS